MITLDSIFGWRFLSGTGSFPLLVKNYRFMFVSWWIWTCVFSPNGMILLKIPINHLFWLRAHVHPPTGNLCTQIDSHSNYLLIAKRNIKTSCGREKWTVANWTRQIRNILPFKNHRLWTVVRLHRILSLTSLSSFCFWYCENVLHRT